MKVKRPNSILHFRDLEVFVFKKLFFFIMQKFPPHKLTHLKGLFFSGAGKKQHFYSLTHSIFFKCAEFNFFKGKYATFGMTRANYLKTKIRIIRMTIVLDRSLIYPVSRTDVQFDVCLMQNTNSYLWECSKTKNVGMKSSRFSRWLRHFFLVNRVEHQKLNQTAVLS